MIVHISLAMDFNAYALQKIDGTDRFGASFVLYTLGRIAGSISRIARRKLLHLGGRGRLQFSFLNPTHLGHPSHFCSSSRAKFEGTGRRDYGSDEGLKWARIGSIRDKSGGRTVGSLRRIVVGMRQRSRNPFPYTWVGSIRR